MYTNRFTSSTLKSGVGGISRVRYRKGDSVMVSVTAEKGKLVFSTAECYTAIEWSLDFKLQIKFFTFFHAKTF